MKNYLLSIVIAILFPLFSFSSQINILDVIQVGPIKGPDTVCQADTVLYTIEPVFGTLQYQREVPVGWFILSGQETNCILVTAGSVGGEVKVTLYSTSVVGNTEKKDVEVRPLPAAVGVITGNFNPCEQTQQIYSVSPVSYATEYLWEVPLSWTIISGGGTNSITVIVKESGYISIHTANDCGYGLIGAISLITVDPLPELPGAITGPDSVIYENTAVYSVESVPNTNTYFWEIPSSWTIISGQGTNSLAVIVRESGYIYMTPSNECGPSAISSSKQVLSYLPVSIQDVEISYENNQIKINSFGKKILINVYDISGRCILSSTKENFSLLKGLYLIHLVENDRKYIKKIFIK